MNIAVSVIVQLSCEILTYWIVLRMNVTCGAVLVCLVCLYALSVPVQSTDSIRVLRGTLVGCLDLILTHSHIWYVLLCFHIAVP